MATLPVDNDLDFGFVTSLKNALVEVLTALPAGLIEGGLVFLGGADHHFYGNDGTNDRQIPWADDLTIFQDLGADPTGAALVANKKWYNTADGVLKYSTDGTVVKTIATTDQISTMFRARNTAFDASGGALPVLADANILTGEALQLGDTFTIGTGGTIAGIGGADVLEPGDLLVLFDPANAALPASWTAYQVNVDLPSGILVSENVTVAIAANTPANAGAATTVTAVQHAQVYDNANIHRQFVQVTCPPGATPANVILNSVNAIAGSRVVLFGTV